MIAVSFWNIWDILFTKMLLGQFSMFHMNFDQRAEFDCTNGNFS